MFFWHEKNIFYSTILFEKCTDQDIAEAARYLVDEPKKVCWWPSIPGFVAGVVSCLVVGGLAYCYWPQNRNKVNKGKEIITKIYDAKTIIISFIKYARIHGSGRGGDRNFHDDDKVTR